MLLTKLQFSHVLGGLFPFLCVSFLILLFVASFNEILSVFGKQSLHTAYYQHVCVYAHAIHVHVCVDFHNIGIWVVPFLKKQIRTLLLKQLCTESSGVL